MSEFPAIQQGVVANLPLETPTESDPVAAILRAIKTQDQSKDTQTGRRAPELTGDISYIPFRFTDSGTVGLGSHETAFGNQALLGYGYCRAIDVRENGGDSISPSDEDIRLALRLSLLEVRSFLATSDPAEQAYIAKKLFEAEPLPASLAEELGGAVGGVERLKLLNTRSPEGSSVVSDETIIKLLAWHNARTIDRQKAYEKVIQPLRERYIERLQWAEDEGWLDRGTITPERLERIRNISVYIDDDLDFQPERNFPGASAYAVIERNVPSYILIKRVEILTKAQIEAIFTHEMTHIVTGFSSNDVVTGTSSSQETNLYGLRRLFKDSSSGELATFVNEAATDYFTLALLNRGIDRVNLHHFLMLPDAVKPVGYLEGIYFLKKLPIDPILYFRALFEDHPGESADDSLRNELQGQADPAKTPMYGPYVLQLRSELSEIFSGVEAERLVEIFHQHKGNILGAAIRLHQIVRRSQRPQGQEQGHEKH